MGANTPITQTSASHKMTLAIIAHEIGPVSAKPPPHRMTADGSLMDLGYVLQPTIMATHTFANAPALDVLLVPGGVGNRALEQTNDTSVEDFVRLRFDQLDYLLSVCTGAMSLAKAGVLDGRRATTNKSAWDQVVGSGTNVTWVPSARWVVDGKVWTSSGVSSGEILSPVHIDIGRGAGSPAMKGGLGTKIAWGC